MRPIVSAEEMRMCDAAAIAEGIPAVRLMENAAQGALDVLLHETGSLRRKRILVLCGKGNNGGDGMAFARLAAMEGALITIALPGTPSELSPEAGQQYHRAIRKKIRTVTNSDARVIEKGNWDIVVDALLGTGAVLPLRDGFRALIDAANHVQSFRFALDLPTGLTASGERDPVCTFHAHLTATFGAIKQGMLFGAGRISSGKIRVIPIGLPDAVLDAERYAHRLIEQDDVVERFPHRAPDAHKYSVGKIFALCGSPGMTGAAKLVSRAAMRTGAGMTILGIPESLVPIVAGSLTETIIAAVPENADGAIANVSLSALSQFLDWGDAFVLGCGITKHVDAAATIRAFVERAKSPVVLDADGIAAFAEHHDILRKSAAPIILTPHAAELAALMHLDRQAVMADPIRFAISAAHHLQSIIVLKGGPTVVATPAGVVFVNPTGNPGMATAGSGDVLSGMIAALLGQGCAPLDAAICGVYLHGRAGDLAAEQLSEPSLVAGDIIDYIPAALRTLPVEQTGVLHQLPQ